MPLFQLTTTNPIYKCDRFQTWKKMYLNMTPIENMLKKIDKKNSNKKEITMILLEKQLKKFLKTYLLLELNTHNEKEDFLIKLCKKNNLGIEEFKKKEQKDNSINKYNKLEIKELNKLCEIKKNQRNWDSKLWNSKYLTLKKDKSIIEKIKSYYTHKPYARKYLELSKILNKVLEFKKENIKIIYKFLSEFQELNISFDELINRESTFNLLIKSSLLDKDLKDLRNIYGIFFEKNKEKRKKIFKVIKEGTRSRPILLHFSGIFTITSFFFSYKIFKESKILAIGLIGIFLNIYFSSLSIYLYNLYKINYTYLLEMAEYNRFDLSHTLFFSSIFSLFVFLGCYLNSYSNYLSIPLIILPFIFLIIPYGFLYERKYILQSILKIITLNIFTKKIRLPDFIFADYYNTLAPFFGYISFYSLPEFQITISLSLYIYIFCLHALILRIYQCILRYFETKNKINLFNALKFILNLTSHTLNTFLNKKYKISIILIGTFKIISCSYILYWDLIFDWLFFSNRKSLFHKPIYFLIGLFNSFMRLFPIVIFFNEKLDFGFWFLFLDVFRRNLWGLIRFECEHLNNINGFNDSHFSKVNTLAEFYYKNYQESNSTETELIESDCLDSNLENDLNFNDIITSKKINESSIV